MDIMDAITGYVDAASGFLSNTLLIILLCGTGLYFTFRLKFIQLRKIREGWHQVFGKMLEKNAGRQKGEMTPFQSVATAIAAQVGTGNLAGAATALASGGPGAIFWMWVSAFLGMSTIYAEATLAQEYKTMANGEVTGGPVYYIKAAFRGKLGKCLAAIFAVLIVLALGFAGNMVQSNSIGAAFGEVFRTQGLSIPPIAVGVALAAACAVVFFGGVERLAGVVEKLVPIMAGIYILGSGALIVMNMTALPRAFMMILTGAFNPQAVLGAGAGITVREAVRYGVARGLFSNEAGMGSTPHAHARAKVENPHQQGLAAMVSVFVDTFIILNLTVFSILTTDVMSTGKSGTALTQAAFASAFGNWGELFVAVCLLFFAFSTILGWHFFGMVNVKYLFGEKSGKVYSLIVVGCILLGSTLRLDLVWSLSDFFNGLMVIPNAVSLWALSGVVVGIARKYSEKKSGLS